MICNHNYKPQSVNFFQVTFLPFAMTLWTRISFQIQSPATLWSVAFFICLLWWRSIIFTSLSQDSACSADGHLGNTFLVLLRSPIHTDTSSSKQSGLSCGSLCLIHQNWRSNGCSKNNGRRDFPHLSRHFERWDSITHSWVNYQFHKNEKETKLRRKHMTMTSLGQKLWLKTK